MNRLRFLGAGGLIALVLGLALYLQPWVRPTVAVTVETMTLAPVLRVLAVNGRIAADHSVEVRPLVGGTLTELFVAEGDMVGAGADLAWIDSAAQHAIVRQAMAGLDAALVAQDEAEATYARIKALGTIETRSALDSAARAAQTAAQDVARMSALLEQAQIRLRDFVVHAPMAGTVIALSAEPGQVVDTATILMTMVNLDQLLVETDVDEAYATQIRVGQPVALRLTGETAVHDGHVSFVSQNVDISTGGLEVKLTPEQPIVAPIGLTVTANIMVDDRKSAITVPRAAIVHGATDEAVFVVGDGTARRRVINAIDWPAERLIVTEGLSPGDIVIADATGISDGQAVMVSKP